MLCELFNTVVLAAGKSKRMSSNISKVLHRIGGKFILKRVIDTAVEIGSKDIYVVYGDPYSKECLMDILEIQECAHIHWVLQSPSHGTGHAVKQVLPFLSDNMNVLVLYGDVPLLSSHTLRKLFHVKPQGGISLLTVFLEEPNGYGRIIRRDGGEVIDIIEDRDADNSQKLINEVNTGTMIVTGRDLKNWVNRIKNINNFNFEFYLTDIINIAWNEGRTINTMSPNEDYEICGVNDKLQLVSLERVYQRKQAERLISSGVVLCDLNRFDLRGELYHGDDVYIDVNVIIEGKVSIGNRVNIGIGCVLKNSVIEDDVVIYPYSLIDGTKICSNSVVGPFARLRSGSELGKRSCIGNFVELKNTKLGNNSKIGHISYMGDVDIGRMVNIGAGAIVCNYDGVDKYKTIIGDNVFVGADSQLVAPVTIGSGAKIGAGTTVTRDVLPNEVVISRIRQFPITCWKRSLKKGNKD